MSSAVALDSADLVNGATPGDGSDLNQTPVDADVEELTLNFIVFPPSQARPALERFALAFPSTATGADLKKMLKNDVGYTSRWLQLVHLGRVISDHEVVASFDVAAPRDVMVIIPKPARLLAKQDWWRHQERDLMQPSIDAALGDTRWPPLFVGEETGPSANFTRRHEVWMRRIAQLASVQIVEAVPEPSFVENDDGGVQTPEQALQDERAFALNEVIASWEENGWQLRDGVSKIWAGDRDPVSIVRMNNGRPANRHSQFVLNCILVTTNIHERALFAKDPKAFGRPCPEEVVLKLNKTLADSRANSDDKTWPPAQVQISSTRARDFITEHEIWLRRTAQIANEKVTLRIPFPCFDKGGVEKEREAVRPHILRWTARGIRIKDGVEKLWAGERDLEKLTANMSRNSSLVMHVLLVTTQTHEAEQARIEKEAEGIDLGELAALLMGDSAASDSAKGTTESSPAAGGGNGTADMPDLIDQADVTSSDSEHEDAPAPARGSGSGSGSGSGASNEATADAAPAPAAASGSGAGSSDDAAAAARLVSEVTNLLLQNTGTSTANASAQVIHDDGDTTDSGHDDSFSYTSDASADFSGDYDDEFEMPVLAPEGGEYVEVRAETDDESARASAAEGAQNASENETGEEEDEPFRNTLEIAIRMSLQDSSEQPASAAAATGSGGGARTAASSSGPATAASGADAGATLSGSSAPEHPDSSSSNASSGAAASSSTTSATSTSTGGAAGTSAAASASAALAANLSRLEQALRPIPFQRTRSHPAPSRSGIISMATAGGSHRSRSSSRRRAEEAAGGGTRSPGSGATSPRSGASSSAGSELSRGYPMRRTRSAGNGPSSLSSAHGRPRSRSNRRSRSRDTTSASASSSQPQPQTATNGADSNNSSGSGSGGGGSGSSSSSGGNSTGNGDSSAQ